MSSGIAYPLDQALPSSFPLFSSGVWVFRASAYFLIHRSTLRYRPRFPSIIKEEIDNTIVELSIEHPELGSYKVGRLVRNRGLRIGSQRVRMVREVMMGLIERHGAPGYVRSDNGPEFVVKSIQAWLAYEKIKTLYIDPGCPWQNGYVESFHDKFRRECLARKLFFTLSEAKVVIAA